MGVYISTIIFIYKYVWLYIYIHMYGCWPMSYMTLNFMIPLIHGLFSIVNSTVLQDMWLVESVNADLWIWTMDMDELHILRANYKLYVYFQVCGELAHLIPGVFKGQTLIYKYIWLYSYMDACEYLCTNI